MQGGAFGVDAAAQFYFNKSAKDVTLSESAMLAGLFKAPAKYAHRVLHESLHGALDRATMVCHSCDNPPCCNPAHLWAGTAKDNAADMVAKKRHPLHNLTACGRGHPFTPESHYVSNGRRHCLKCARIRANARADRRAGWVPEEAA